MKRETLLIKPEILFKESYRTGTFLKDSVRRWLTSIVLGLMLAIILGNIVYALATQ